MKQKSATGTKRFLLLLGFALMSTTFLFAQTRFEVPQNVKMVAKEDYANYETDIINATKWLEETPLDKEPEKRKQVSAFVLQWITGCPNVNIELTPPLQKIYEKNNPLLLLYMAGYSKYFIEHKTDATKFAAAKEGLITMMNVYKKGININKNKEMNKLIKLTDEGKLDDYMNEKLISLFWEEYLRSKMGSK